MNLNELIQELDEAKMYLGLAALADKEQRLMAAANHVENALGCLAGVVEELDFKSDFYMMLAENIWLIDAEREG